jgi:Tol biopolymer transport system component
MTRLTFGEDTDSMDPIWTPDGERIIYASSRESVFFGKGDIYGKPADGTGEADKLASASDRGYK